MAPAQHAPREPLQGSRGVQDRIAIASYNIHSGIGLDRRRSSSRIARVLKELECDIYALQEVDNQPGEHEESMQLEYFERALNMTAVPGLRIVRHTGEYGNAILTRLPVLSVRRHDLSHSWFEPRGALDVQVEVKGQPLRVIATHLGLRRSERRAQWRALMMALAEAPEQLPTILLGDMNEWYPRAVTLQEADRAFGQSSALPAFPSFAPFLTLTRIWVRPRDALLSIEAHRSEAARRASDHLPVKALVDVNRLRPADGPIELLVTGQNEIEDARSG
jgi:endonuclease/exonuclease/phosphatase family metal-dependent hydrolase